MPSFFGNTLSDLQSAVIADQEAKTRRKSVDNALLSAVMDSMVKRRRGDQEYDLGGRGIASNERIANQDVGLRKYLGDQNYDLGNRRMAFDEQYGPVKIQNELDIALRKIAADEALAKERSEQNAMLANITAMRGLPTETSADRNAARIEEAKILESEQAVKIANAIQNQIVQDLFEQYDPVGPNFLRDMPKTTGEMLDLIGSGKKREYTTRSLRDLIAKHPSMQDALPFLQDLNIIDFDPKSGGFQFKGKFGASQPESDTSGLANALLEIARQAEGKDTNRPPLFKYTMKDLRPMKAQNTNSAR